MLLKIKININMTIRNIKVTTAQFICLLLYYLFLRYLPSSTFPVFGKTCKYLRYICCKKIFKNCGNNVNIERKAFFASGVNLQIGDNSGIGINSVVPGDIFIGQNVMMGPNCYILGTNHRFNRTDIPMIYQGKSEKKHTIIEDDVWIGRDVTFTPGRIVKKGSIIGVGCVLTKNFPEYSIIGGNPSRLIKSRL